MSNAILISKMHKISVVFENFNSKGIDHTNVVTVPIYLYLYNANKRKLYLKTFAIFSTQYVFSLYTILLFFTIMDIEIKMFYTKASCILDLIVIN